MPLKVSFQKENHVLKSVPTHFSELLDFIQKSFKSLPKQFQLYYKDSEGDKITISCVEDLKALQDYSKYPKVLIEAVNESTEMIEGEEMNSSRIFSDVDEFQFIRDFVKKADEKTVQPEQSKKVDQIHYLPPQKVNEDDDKWACEQCTFLNSNLSNDCQICYSIRVMHKGISVKPKTEEIKTDMGIVQPIKIETVQEPKKEEKKVIQEPKTWSCSACTYVNRECDFWCDICSTQKPYVEPPRVPQVKSNPPAKKEDKKEKERKRSESKCKKVKSMKIVKKEKIETKPVEEKKEEDLKTQVQKEIQSQLKNIAEQVKQMIQNEKVEEQAQNDFFSDLIGEKPKQEEKPKCQQVVHKSYICDGCNKGPIVGVRYKCSVCEDFDYCEQCEATLEHDHPFLKIKKLEHNPRMIVVVLDDQNDIQSNQNEIQVQNFLNFQQAVQTQTHTQEAPQTVHHDDVKTPQEEPKTVKSPMQSLETIHHEQSETEKQIAQLKEIFQVEHDYKTFVEQNKNKSVEELIQLFTEVQEKKMLDEKNKRRAEIIAEVVGEKDLQKILNLVGDLQSLTDDELIELIFNGSI